MACGAGADGASASEARRSCFDVRMDAAAVRAPSSGAGRRMLPLPIGWALCLALGLGLGWLCRFPLVYTYLTGWAVAWKAGWASIDPTVVDDGVSVFFVMIAGLWLLFVLIAAPLTALARRSTPLSGRQWWCTSLMLWAAPFAVLDLPGLLH
jgi:hypothetical protein